MKKYPTSFATQLPAGAPGPSLRSASQAAPGSGGRKAAATIAAEWIAAGSPLLFQTLNLNR